MALACSCVVPQDTQTLDALPLRNRPPRIVENAGMLPPEIRTPMGPDCSLDFVAFVDDPDEDDLLRFRWYLDYRPNANDPLRKLSLVDGTIQPNTTGDSTVRTTAATWKLTPQELELADPTTSTHVITLLVTDGELAPSQGPRSTPLEVPVEGTTVKDPRYAVSYSWIIDIDPTVSCPPPAK